MLNRNYNKTIFGGSIFSAIDPIYVFMYWQILTRRGFRIQSWIKSASIDYYKPGDSDLSIRFALSEEDITVAEQALKDNGKFIRKHTIEVLNASNELCARAESEIYMRKIP